MILNWDPITWLFSFLLILLFVYFIRSVGNKEYNTKNKQSEPFTSGNIAEKESLNAGDVYWGFMNAFRFIYEPLVKLHTGNINDYISVFIIVVVLISLIITFM